MSQETQTINASGVLIKPVQLKPQADILLVVPAHSSSISYVVGKLIPGTPAKLGKGATLESGTPGAPDYQPYVPAVNGVAFAPDSIMPLDQGTIEMTDAEWAAWNDQPDNEYRTSVVAARLGLTTLSDYVATA